MDKDKSGALDETEFAHLLGLPPSSPVVEEIFHLFDRNGDGALGILLKSAVDLILARLQRIRGRFVFHEQGSGV